MSTNIAAKELVSIILAASLWGPYWHREGVCFRSDNMAVVDVLCSRTAHDPLLMHLYAAIYQFDFRAEHLPGSHNLAADALSRNNLTLFSSLVPQMQQVAIPQPAQDLLVETTPNWGLHDWTILFRNSLNRGSPRPPLQCTGQAGAILQHHCPHPTEDTLCRFAAMMSQTVAWGTVRIYISALRYFQIRAGLQTLPCPLFPALVTS